MTIIKNALLDRLDILLGHSVLDLGCGNGVHSQYVKQLAPRLLVALDLNFVALRCITPLRSYASDAEFRTETSSGISLVCADALNLPFPPETFDRVICSLVLYFLPFDVALCELHRLVKPGGKVYLRVPLLAWERLIYILRYARSDPRKSIYTALLLTNSLFYYFWGRQPNNPFLRHERLTSFIPRKRFDEAVAKAGFSLDYFEVAQPEPGTAALDAWLRRTQ